MSDTLALLALMNKGEGLTEEQVNQVIDGKNLQPKLTAGENITISADNVISATDTGLTQEQVNTLIDSKNLQPKLTAGTNITIDSNNVISSIDTGLNETEVNTLIDSKNLQPKLTAGTNITIEGNVISSTDTGLNETEVNTLIDNKNLQPKLTAGENITISADNVISATASGGGYSVVVPVGDSSGAITNDSTKCFQTGSKGGLIVGDTEGNGKFKIYNGSLAFGRTYNKDIQSLGAGSIAGGSNGQQSTLIDPEGIRADGNGSVAIGYSDGVIRAHSWGSVVMGYADKNVYMSSRAEGSIALGYNVNAGINNNKGCCAIGKNNVDDSNYAFMIGNGSDNNNRSNALTVDWAGNLVCNNIPAAPTADGNYVLKCSIVGGVPTYSWVAEQ